MRRSFFGVPFITIAFSASLLIPTGAFAQGDQGPDQMHGRQVWEADHEALLDAKLGGLKAGLKLTPDQEKLWAPFEAAVRSAAQMRMQHMQAMMDRMHKMRNGMDDQEMTDRPDMMEMGEGAEGASPVDRLAAIADRMSQAAAAVKQIADTAKPLYASLDDSQKRIFGFLAREMLMMGHRPGGMGGWRHRHHGDEGGPDEQE